MGDPVEKVFKISENNDSKEEKLTELQVHNKKEKGRICAEDPMIA